MLRSKYNCRNAIYINIIQYTLPIKSWIQVNILGDVVEENESNPDENNPNPEEGEGQESETTEAAATKPTTKNPMCQYNPGLPMCKQ